MAKTGQMLPALWGDGVTTEANMKIVRELEAILERGEKQRHESLGKGQTLSWALIDALESKRNCIVAGIDNLIGEILCGYYD